MGVKKKLKKLFESRLNNETIVEPNEELTNTVITYDGVELGGYHNIYPKQCPFFTLAKEVQDYLNTHSMETPKPDHIQCVQYNGHGEICDFFSSYDAQKGRIFCQVLHEGENAIEFMADEKEDRESQERGE